MTADEDGLESPGWVMAAVRPRRENRRGEGKRRGKEKGNVEEERGEQEEKVASRTDLASLSTWHPFRVLKTALVDIRVH